MHHRLSIRLRGSGLRWGERTPRHSRLFWYDNVFPKNQFPYNHRHINMVQKYALLLDKMYTYYITVWGI